MHFVYYYIKEGLMIFLISYAIPICLAVGVFLASCKHYKNKWR